MAGAFPNQLFNFVFLVVSRCYDNDGGSPAGCAVGGMMKVNLHQQFPRQVLLKILLSWQVRTHA